jgi:hypothetical protein
MHFFEADLFQEMSSEERRAADQKIKEENFFKSLGAGEQEAETEGFQCSRCKQVRFFRRIWWLGVSSFIAQVSLSPGADQKR